MKLEIQILVADPNYLILTLAQYQLLLDFEMDFAFQWLLGSIPNGGAEVGETFIEDNIFYIEPEAIKNGYNFITVDLPGQGMLPAKGFFFRKDTETQMKAILDVIQKFPEVDPEKLAVYGISNGGYFVPRAATVEKRIKAVVVSSVVRLSKNLTLFC